MNPLSLLFILSFFVLVTGCNPGEKDSRNWYKGNLHTHSYWSDGDEYPEMIMDWYKSKGYNFVALSDHNILAENEKWVTVAKSKMYEDGFQKYLDKFGDKWVTHNTDSGRIHVKLKTYDEYKPL
ncbi:MAG: histidinol-phosphatase, partial [Marivirga sp.]|nr:histidinol-phosphatase [Marivirga sp.]